MIDSSDGRDAVELLAEEFARRCRDGERPSVCEYVSAYPEYAEQIEQLFPALARMEQFCAAEKSVRESVLRRTVPGDIPEQLGDFDIIQKIGRGGMGIVYEAEQRSLARRVALKVLPQHALLTEKHREQFQQEAQTAAKLRHTGIVSVFGVGEQDGWHYYVMPLIRGAGLDEIIREPRSREASPGGGNESLGELVRRVTGKKFPAARSHMASGQGSGGRGPANRWVEAALLGVQAAEALEYAHAQGTLHRDVKPGNVLVDERGNACLADFGLARIVSSATAMDTPSRGADHDIVGTPRYMAPEQQQGRADARSDIYGLGMTLYELLTLQSPEGGESAESPRRDVAETATAGRPPVAGGPDTLASRSTLARRKNQSGEPACRPTKKCRRRRFQSIPRDLEAIVLKCLAADPARRYPTAGALAVDLRHFLQDKPIRARRASWVETAWRWCRRNAALAAVSALALLLVVAFVATAVVGHMRTRNAYAQTRQALSRAEATSGVALEALEDLYLQLSPERVWIHSDADPAGQACACMGLRSARPATSTHYVQLQPSEQTAVLLENLLVFYNRLAEQVSDDAQIMLESAVATRRVGDIRERLGQIDRAEREYLKAANKLKQLRKTAHGNVKVLIELARSYNEVGNVRSARFETEAACQAHQDALDALRSTTAAKPFPEEYRYELARTYFFLSHEQLRGAAGQWEHREAAGPVSQPLKEEGTLEKVYRTQAIRLLEELTQANPGAADYRFLLALCYRPSGVGPELEQQPAAARNRERALNILESLKKEYPQVADYRYELAATYAWVPVGFFPWQGGSIAGDQAEEGLRKALKEARWLVDHNPTILRYARCQALALAKLGTVCCETKRFSEAASLFEQALRAQTALVREFPHLPAHDRVLLEFFRLRLATVYDRQRAASDKTAPSDNPRHLLNTCVRNLRNLVSQPAVANDRLASSTLRIARAALSWSTKNRSRVDG